MASSEIEVGAYIKDRLPKGFMLDEEKLRNIHELITKRTEAEGFEEQPLYKVYRADALVFSTEDIDLVIGEENSKSRRIERLSIRIDSSEHENIELRLGLDFSKYGTDIDIEGTDKDLVNLLSLDLQSYLSREVNTKKKWNVYNIVVTAMFVGLFVWAVIWAVLFHTSPVRLFNSANSVDLESLTLEQKIDFLVLTNFPTNLFVRSANRSFEVFFWVYLAYVLFLAYILYLDRAGRLESLYEYINPKDFFLFGRERERYEQILRLRSNIFWAVGIGLTVSVVGSLLVWAITGSVS